MLKTEPRQEVTLAISAARGLTATLGRRPLEVIRPEFENKPVDLVAPTSTILSRFVHDPAD